MSSHGLGRSTIYDSVWAVVDAVNQSPDLTFNSDGAEFPSFAEQDEIANGFLERSAAGFDNVVGAIDGMLIWTEKPSLTVCREMRVCQNMFHCYRKDKFGLVMLAICDHRTKFRWVDISEPGRASDYLSWIRSGLPAKLDARNIIRSGMTLIGDNAFVNKMYMAVPFPGTGLDVWRDAYNFYLSQLRITIERAFGILIHRWGILRKPLSCPVSKVGALVMCLCRLHNFCIDNGSAFSAGSTDEDERSIRRVARHRSQLRGGTMSRAVRVDEHGRPTELLGGGHHFADVPGRGRPTADNASTPMDAMLAMVADRGLVRPPIYRG
jgi:hypothetical protein